MVYYKCLKCNYKSNIFTDIKRHINISKICVKSLNNSYFITDDENVILSLLPYDDNDNQIINKETMKKYNNIYINRKILLNALDNKNNKKSCPYCNKVFDKIQHLKEHIIIDCFQDYINNKDDTKITNITTNNQNIIQHIELMF